MIRLFIRGYRYFNAYDPWIICDTGFRFQLTREEIDELSRSKNLTSIQTKGVKGGRAYLPWAFTESGVYMLMTVLKGDLATRQSKPLIRTFRAMKDYIVDKVRFIKKKSCR